ncbi:MAG: hypothetical protein GXP47_02425 [Acidobacteria bacterium]|nr:hypothetical protein [Acidobacteriota bacterium]
MTGAHILQRPCQGRRGLAAMIPALCGFLLVAGSLGCASSSGSAAAKNAGAASSAGTGAGRPKPAREGAPTPAVPPGGGSGGAEAAEPCEEVAGARTDWLDRIHSWVGHTICRTINGFDGFFGDQRSEDERNRTGGLLGLNLRWSEHDALQPQLRFRARFALPNLSRRFKLFVGRQTEDEYLRDSAKRSVNDMLASERDYKWVLGLGGATSSLKRSRFRFNVGVKLSSTPQLYGKGQYRWLFPMGTRRLGRFRQTVFWRSRDGFGTTTNLDLEQRFESPFLLRWEGSGTISEISAGVEWFSGLSLYQELNMDLAARYRAWVRGATDAPVRTGEYGFEVFLRKRMFRPWLFGQVGSGISWIRDHPWERRKASLSILVGAEMQFGSRTVY